MVPVHRTRDDRLTKVIETGARGEKGGRAAYLLKPEKLTDALGGLNDGRTARLTLPTLFSPMAL